jgi:hypothetical protein
MRIKAHAPLYSPATSAGPPEISVIWTGVDPIVLRPVSIPGNDIVVGHPEGV